MPRRIELSFRTRLLLTMMLLMLLVQALTALSVLREHYTDSLQQAEKQLLRGRDIVDQILTQRITQLLDSAKALSSDISFQSAISNQNLDHIESALTGRGEHIGASLRLLTDPLGKPLLTTLAADESGETPFPELQLAAQTKGSANGVGILHQQAWYLTLVPAKAPDLLGWVGLGFPLDPALAQTLSQLTGMDVAFVPQPSLMISTLDKSTDSQALLNEVLASDKTGNEQVQDTGNTFAVTHSLQHNGLPALQTLLIMPKAQALETFYSLQINLLILFSISLIGSLIAALWLSRQLGRPLMQLANAAQRIGRGEYLFLPTSHRRGEIGLLARTLETMQDDIRTREQQVHYQARHDPLTGLPNRVTTDEYLQECLQQHMPALMIRLSIRDLKAINDSLGYRYGDAALRSVASRLQAYCGQNDLLARTGSKDFVLVLPGAKGTSEEETLARVEDIRQQIEQPITMLDSPMPLKVIMGVLCLPDDAQDMNTLWRRATITFDASQRQGGATQLYRNGMDESHLRALSLMRDLSGAITDNQLSMRYQPKLNLADRQIHQFEALVRWQHPTLGFVPPDEFIMLAERSGQIGQVTRWVLSTVLRHIKESWSQGLEVGASINLSAHDLLDRSLAPYIENLLIDWSGPRQRLTLEVTESALMEDPALALQTLDALKALGLRLSIDDFGTGYSSLAQLKRLPVDELKIDKSFVMKLDQDEDDQTIVRSTIELAHSLGLNVVAEGVETAAGWSLLEQYGCDILQGYFIARPLPTDEVKAWLHSFEERRASLPPPAGADQPQHSTGNRSV